MLSGLFLIILFDGDKMVGKLDKFEFSEIKEMLEIRYVQLEDKEFWYPKSSMGIEYSESPQTFYYKVSNDTLYISVYEAIIVPKLWKSKTIIIQEEESHFVTKQGIHGWKVVDEEKRKNRLEKLGYRRFP